MTFFRTTTQPNAVLGLGNYRVILLNATGGVTIETSEADILNQEPFSRTGGYAPQAYTYTANSATWNSALQRAVVPAVLVGFTEGAGQPGYSYNRVILWHGRGAIANRPITSVNTTNGQIVCTAHGLSAGDRAFVRSEGTLPAGYTVQRYWTQVIDVNTVILHTNVGLTAPVIPTNTGTGQLHLQHANGSMAGDPTTVSSTTIAAGQTRSFNVTVRF